MSADEQTAGARPALPVSGAGDADDLRGHHFRRLLHKWTTWAWIGLPTVVAAVAGFVIAGAVLAIVFAVLVVLIGIFVVWKIADSRAAEDFFRVYAKQHDLKLDSMSELGSATPFLRRGMKQYADRPSPASWHRGLTASSSSTPTRPSR